MRCRRKGEQSMRCRRKSEQSMRCQRKGEQSMRCLASFACYCGRHVDDGAAEGRTRTQCLPLFPSFPLSIEWILDVVPSVFPPFSPLHQACVAGAATGVKRMVPFLTFPS
eukprot:350657-Chlamydomonas_euryale.AAC.7